MPLYEYLCDNCGHRFEVIQKFSDPPLEQCPKCGGPVHKLQSAPAFQFKGTGWYVTDYPSASRKQAMESEKSGKSATTADKSTSEKSASSDGGSTSSSASSSSPSAPSSSSASKD